MDWSKLQEQANVEAFRRKAARIGELERQRAARDPALTPEEQAILQFRSRAERERTLCGCLGPQPLDDQPACNGTNWDDIKRYPLCPCSMRWVEEVDMQYFKVTEHKGPNGITHSATLLGPVGGPYSLDHAQ